MSMFKIGLYFCISRCCLVRIRLRLEAGVSCHKDRGRSDLVCKETNKNKRQQISISLKMEVEYTSLPERVTGCQRARSKKWIVTTHSLRRKDFLMGITEENSLNSATIDKKKGTRNHTFHAPRERIKSGAKVISLRTPLNNKTNNLL